MARPLVAARFPGFALSGAWLGLGSRLVVTRAAWLLVPPLLG